MLVDLRSDTLTQPTPAMLEAMLSAEVGDDVWNEDPTVRRLEEHVAERFGKEAGVLCPSGTMTNQIALRAVCGPGDEVICSVDAHIYNYEGGGIAANAGASVRFPAFEDRGRFIAREVALKIQPDDPHAPRTRLVAIEDTVNRGGGAIWPYADVLDIGRLCEARGLHFHLDGARVMNRLVATDMEAPAYAAPFHSVSLCLSKGLGAPVGSVLVGQRAFIARARRFRKMMGGGMRQAGYLAAAGLYALEHHVARLADDHRHARILAEALDASRLAKEVWAPETNIVIFRPSICAEDAVRTLEAEGIKGAGMGDKVRLVTHLGATEAAIQTAAIRIRKL